MPDKHSKIYVAGHRGLVGSAILRRLEQGGYDNIVVRTSRELDLTDQAATEAFFAAEKPEQVYLCAAKVGGIMANSRYPAEFIYRNLTIGANIIHAAWKHGVKKLLNMGSSCIYPRLAPQPMREDALLTSALEPTNEGYALAKIAAIKLCRCYNQQYGTNFISVMPTNQYGVGDNFNMETAHLLPMTMRRFHLARLLHENSFDAIRADLRRYPLGWGLDEQVDFSSEASLEHALNAVGAYRDHVVMWGDGSARRELMCSDDLADACVYLMENRNAADIGEFVNITDGTDILLSDLFELVRNIVGFAGHIEYDAAKPNGTPRKLMDATKIRGLGWVPKVGLKEGIRDCYGHYITQIIDVKLK